MNERIIELANEANKDIGYTFKMEEAKQLHELMDKFAELIVRECLDQCYNRGMNDELYAGQLKAAAYIEEHFGVK